MKDIQADSQIVKEVEIGRGGDITVLQGLQIDDEVVWEREGDSLLSPLIIGLAASSVASRLPVKTTSETEALYYQADTGDYGYGTVDPSYLSKGGGNDENPIWHTINGVSGSDPITVSLGDPIDRNVSEGYTPSPSDVIAVYITGAGGNLNGRHKADLTVVDATTLEVDVSAAGPENASDAYAGIAIDVSKIGNIPDYDPDVDHMISDAIFALGTGSGANTENTGMIHSIIYNGQGSGELQYNPLTKNPPVVNLTQQISTIKFSREVDNQSGSEIRAREIAVLTKAGAGGDGSYSQDETNYYVTAIARDVIDVTIPNNQVISFTYKIRTSSEDNGGIMTNFNEMLYRQLAKTTRTVQDVNNNDQDDGFHINQFDVRGSVGHRVNLAGPVVGTGTTIVDEANYNLDNRVPYGTNDGELFKVGGHVSSVQSDNQNNQTYVDFVSIFENRGSTTIGINEVGLITDGRSGPVLIARSLTSQQEDVAPGDTIEVRYRFALNV